jgi:oligogalacturonide lyase
VAGTDGGYNAIGPDGKPMSFAAAKEYRMAQRLAAEVPMDIFTIDIRTGTRKVLVHSNDWLNHMPVLARRSGSADVLPRRAMA